MQGADWQFRRSIEATMNARLMVYLVLAGAVLTVGPATAAELFRAGVVSCVSLSRSVTAMSLNRCQGGENPAKREMFGSCEGSYVANRTRVPFVVSAYIREMSKFLPDNNKPLRFDYRGMRCQVQTWRLRSVHNCSPLDDGNGLACQVCVTLFGKHCYDARMMVTARR
jgi:hypothetical protein